MTGIGEVKSGLYHILPLTVSPRKFDLFDSILASVVNHTEEFNLWQYRIRHPSLSVLAFEVTIPKLAFHNTPCSICPLAN